MIEELKPYPKYKDSGLPWLGKVPVGWEVIRAKNTISNVVHQTTTKCRNDIYIALEHVESWTGKTRQAVGDSLFTGQVKRFIKGDVLFGKLRPYLAKVTLSAANGVCAGEFFVLRPRSTALAPAFIEHLFRSRPTIDVINGSTFGAKMPRADWQFVGNLSIPLPPSEEQAAIVRFLDHANGKIERAIRVKRKLIALLTEQKQAIIHRAVTRGLDPHVKLKPSGIPWLGDVPEGWETWRIRRFARVGNGSTPSRAKPTYWNGGSYPWLNSSQMNRGYIDSADQFVTQVALRECHLPRVPAGSVLVAITGQGKTRGTAAVLGFETTINQHVAYITPRAMVVTPDYLHLTLSAAYQTLRALSEDSGSTKGALTCADLKRFKVVLPPLPQQAALVVHIRNQTQTLDTVLDRTEREIALLREYRTTLTAEVVTGKLDVRDVAKRLPAEAEEPVLAEDVDNLEEIDTGETEVE